MNPADVTLRAINEQQYRDQESSFRRHLGASKIGEPCARNVWFGFRWARDTKAEARMLRLWNRGHIEEPRFAQYLREVGATVWTADDKGKQFRIVDCGGHFGGSCDGVAVNVPGLPAHPVLLEMKTHNEKSFAKLKKEGLLKSKPMHFKQAQVYMRGLGLAGCLYMAVNKNDDDLFLYYFPRDVQEGEQLKAKAESIIFTDQAPARIADSPSWFACTFCDFKGVCFGTQMPHVNCRTCAHSTPERDGTWSCRFGQMAIHAKPEIGCALHIYNPTFFPHAEVQSMSLELNQITYNRKGQVIVNGTNATPSSELDLTC